MTTNDQPIAGGVKELGHVVQYVRDLERSVRLYGMCSGGARSCPRRRSSPWAEAVPASPDPTAG